MVGTWNLLFSSSRATGTSTTIGREGTPSRLFRQLGSGGSLQPRRVWHGTHNRSLGVNSVSSFFAWQLTTEVSSLQLKISGTFLNRKETSQITIIFTFNTVLSCGPHWRISCLVWPLQTINLLLIVAPYLQNDKTIFLTKDPIIRKSYLKYHASIHTGIVNITV